MSRSTDETRREFLKRLARTAAFVPPALVTLDASGASAQKAGQPGGTKGKGAQQAAAAAQQQAASQSAVAQGGTTPAAQTQGRFRVDPGIQSGQQNQPWDPGRAAGTPPWAKPPPTSAGGGD